MTLYEFAHNELELAELSTTNENGIQIMTQSADLVLKLMDVLNSEEENAHSRIAVDLFWKLSKRHNLTPLTGDDSEWHPDSSELLLNKRSPRVTKSSNDGACFYDEAIVFCQDDGKRWTGFAWLDDLRITSRQQIKQFPFMPKTFFVSVSLIEFGDSEYRAQIIKPEELGQVWEIYQKPF